MLRKLIKCCKLQQLITICIIIFLIIKPLILNQKLKLIIKGKYIIKKVYENPKYDIAFKKFLKIIIILAISNYLYL